MVIGGILAGLGYILLSRTGSYLTFLLVYLGVLSLGFNAGFMQGALAAVNQWFVRRRALAMSAIIAAFAAGGALVTPVLSLAVLHLGWRTAAVLSGLVILTVVVPLCFLVRRSPESMGLLPDGAPAREEPSRSARARGGPRPAPPAEFTVREAAGTPTYWLLAVATALRIAVHGAIIIHFVPLLVWKGLDRQAAANLVGLLAFLSIPLRLTFGYFGDLWPKNRALALGLIPGSLGLLVLLLAGEVWHFYLFVLLFVLAEGVSPLNWALISDLFGRRSFATLRGIMTSFISLGMVVTPVFAGWVFDHTMSYRGALIPFIAIFLVSALIY
jgi:MFS family permease